MAAIQSSRFYQLGRLSYNVGVPCVGSASSRQYSDDVKFLKTLDTAHMKRGRGGRSSFSGVVCTIFGGTGFIGRYVANRLGKTGTQMIFPYRGDSYDVRHLKVAGDLGQVLFCPYHLTDEESIAKAVKHSHVVINLVGRDFPTMNFTLDQVHVEGAARIARISKAMGVERFIHVSALNCDREYEGVHMKGGSPFLAAKGDGEDAVRAEFPESIIFRPSDVYGSEDRYLRYYSNMFRSDNRFLSLHNGGRDIFKQPVYVGDLAQGIVNAVLKDIGQDGQLYQAVGPRRYELSELIRWFLRVLRRTPEVLNDHSQIIDMKYNIIPLIKAKINDRLWSFPINSQTTEKLERETVSDMVTSSFPTLEDLGVSPVLMEDRIEWELRPYRDHQYYEEEIGDFPVADPPKYVSTA